MNKKELKRILHDASKEEIILLLYDGAIRFAERAKESQEGERWDEAHDLMIRAQNIVLELLYALDRKTGGEIAENLVSMYTYVYNRWVEANVHHQTEKIEEGLSILRSLRETWKEAIKKLGAGG